MAYVEPRVRPRICSSRLRVEMPGADLDLQDAIVAQVNLLEPLAALVCRAKSARQMGKHSVKDMSVML